MEQIVIKDIFLEIKANGNTFKINLYQLKELLKLELGNPDLDNLSITLEQKNDN